MIYALQKNAAGTVVACSSWSDPETEIPAGWSACDAADYQAAVAGIQNSLPIQAQITLSSVQQQAVMTVAMGGTFSAAMQAYVKALQAIANGTDTTSTTLPTAPTS